VWLAAWLALAACEARAQAEADDTAKQVRQLTAKYPTARGGAERRAAVLKDLVALGPPGVAAARDLVEKELRVLTAQIGTTPKTAKADLSRTAKTAASRTAQADARLAELRKLLADLRADPNLSHDQLEKVGLPALGELSQIYGRHSAQILAREKKVAKLDGQLQQAAAVVELLRQPGKPPLLPLDEFAAEIRKLQAALSTPEETEVRKVLSENAALAGKLDANVVAGMQAVDAIRMMCGLRPLLYDLKLCEAARGHSGDMQAGNFFSHESPVPGKKTFTDRAKLAGTTASGENIFMGSAVSAAAIKGWFLSPGHHKNMLGPDHRRQGLGYVGKYWTEEFGK
jgi:uncharacterized protein YkwD